MKKISGVYKITNKLTGEFYIGSSNNIKRRWIKHKSPSTWISHPGMKLYQAFIKYSLDNFSFEIIEETSMLKEREQYWISYFHPVYNNRHANGRNIERRKKSKRKYNRTYYKEYRRRLCYINGETLTLGALITRFSKSNIPNPTAEARKYLIE